MPSTTNFGWTTPADTDYVKDGALAIRTLGNGIDTSLVDLKGGTTGQILSKASNTDLDYTWINNDQGDITGVTAGTGLTGGGTSGAVTLAIDSTVATLTGTQTLTNKTIALGSNTVSGTTAQFNTALTDGDFATLAGTETLTNKTIAASSNTITGVINNTLTTTTGDIIYASSANTPARLGIGSSGQVLTVSGGVPTWAAATASGFVGCYAYAPNSSNQTINDSTETVVNLESELIDTDGFHSTSSNTGRITIPSGKGGKYLIIGQVAIGAGNGQGAREVYLKKNNTTYCFTNYPMPNTLQYYPTFMQIHMILDLVATDYIHMTCVHNQGTSLSVRGDGYSVGSTFLAVQYLGA